MSWSPPLYFASLKTALLADATLTGYTPKVRIFTHWPTQTAGVTDGIILHSVTGREESVVLGDNAQDDDFVVRGQIEVIRSMTKGDPEVVATAARLRAGEIFDRLIKAVIERPAAGTQTLSGEITDYDFDQFPALSGQKNTPVLVARIRFGLGAKVRTPLAS